nr:Gag-Pol polyprotein [Tanacetum cinerariifolium]
EEPTNYALMEFSSLNSSFDNEGNPQYALKEKGVIDSGCSRHMTGNISYLSDFEELNGGYVTFGGNQKGGKISRKREFSVPRTPQQNGIAERKNRTLIEAARTILADLLLPIPFWAENTDRDAAFDEMEPEFERRKPESEVNVSPSSSAQSKKHDDKTKREVKGKIPVESSIGYRNLSAEFEDFSDNNINEDNAVGTLVPTVGQISTNSTNTFSAAGPSNAAVKLEDITYSDDEDDVGAEAHFNNLETSITINNDDFHTCMFACFLSQEEHKRVHQAFKDPSWIEAMQKELLQVKMQKVWVLVDLPHGKRAIGTKWVFRNKKDERGIVVRNKARPIVQGHTQDEGIDYEEDFAPIARIEAIRLFLAYASFMGFMVYQMDVKSAFLYETIKEEVYVCQPLGFEDPDYPDKVYKGSRHFMVYIKLLEFDGKSASNPIDTEKPLLKVPDGEDVDVHTYRSMIGSLMYLSSSRPDIMFAVFACAHF